MVGTLDALRTQIDLLQYHRADAARLRRALDTPPAQRELSGLRVLLGKNTGNNLLDSPEYIRDYIASSDLAVRSLENAQTVFVADWVVDTLEDAVDTFPVEYAPHLTDIPFDNGFALLGRQIELRTRPNFTLDVAAISWVRSGSSVVVATYGYSRDANDPLLWRQTIEMKSGYTMTLGMSIEDSIADLPMGDKTWLEIDGDTIIPREIDPEVTAAMMEAETRWSMRFAASLWLFMGDKLVQSESTMAPRAMRRQMDRERLQMEPKVQTIILRTVERPAGWEERPGREYSVRWVVRGHWHRFWVGAKDGPDRRLVPRWVSAYVKGPDDAPLVTPIKLFAVSR